MKLGTTLVRYLSLIRLGIGQANGLTNEKQIRIAHENDFYDAGQVFRFSKTRSEERRVGKECRL